MAAVGHVHHHDARHWFENASTLEIAFCRVTQQGFLRLLTNRAVMGQNVLSMARAWQLYDELLTDGRIRFVAEPSGLENAWRAAVRYPYAGHNFWTDTYLTAFAQTAGYTLVTFDKGFRRYPGLRLELLA